MYRKFLGETPVCSFFKIRVTRWSKVTCGEGRGRNGSYSKTKVDTTSSILVSENSVFLHPGPGPLRSFLVPTFRTLWVEAKSECSWDVCVRV